MAKVRSWVGLDVHARSVLAVTIDGESGEMRSRRLSGKTSEVVEYCCSLPGPTRVAYEAGPTGYGLARALHAAGAGCVVAAPGKIERPAGDKVKTDQRDAERVLRLLMIDSLHPVRVRPARKRRCAISCERARLGERGAQITLLEYLGAIDAIVIRRDALEKTIAELIPGSPWEQTVARLRCLRGIDTLSAVGLCAEVGEFTRFAKARQLMSYLGLTPSEDTSGEKRRLGSITKTGSRHARRLLVEAAWHYRRPPAKGQTLKRARTDSPPTSSRSPGKPNNACTASGNDSTPSAANAARSSRSPSPASSPASAGHWQRRLTTNAPRRLKRRQDRSGHHAREQPRSNEKQL